LLKLYRKGLIYQAIFKQSSFSLKIFVFSASHRMLDISSRCLTTLKAGGAMKEEEVGHGHQGNEQEEHGHCSCVVLVRVSVNDGKVELAPGKYTVAEFKKMANIEAAWDLEEIKGGNKLHPLDDNKHLTIHGCEKFIAHPKEGTAS
jgi:hypothetical protein